MSSDLEVIRKASKTNDEIRQKLINALENGIKLDWILNRRYTFIPCRECNGPMMEHRAEKCRHAGENMKMK